MSEDIAVSQFKRDFIIQTIVQENQFEQWLTLTFYLNQKLAGEYDGIYQNSFYVKLYELLTEGVKYAEKLRAYLKNPINTHKRDWYTALIEGLNDIKASLEEYEFDYIEYRRHSASHIFQDQYEYIQKESLRIKKERNGKKLGELNKGLESLIIRFGSDRDIDEHLNRKIQPKLAAIYETLK